MTCLKISEEKRRRNSLSSGEQIYIYMHIYIHVYIHIYVENNFKKRSSNIATVAQSRLLVCMYKDIDSRSIFLACVLFYIHRARLLADTVFVHTRYNICVYTIFRCVHRRFKRHCVAAD